MNSEQRAIIALAEKEGVSPIEKDARLIVHGMVNATRDQMRKYQVGYDKMGQAQQDCVIAELTEQYEDLAIIIARALASASTPFVIATCKKLEVSNGNFTATIKSDQAHYNDLISKVQDKGEVVIALYERQFRDGMDDIQSDKDQKSLPLDAEPEQKPEKKARAASGTKSAGAMAKAVELTPKLIEDVRAFILDQQNCKTSAIQNFAKCNVGKAEALREYFASEKEGLLVFVGTDASGDYELVRKASETPSVRTIVYKDGVTVITTQDGSDPFEGLDDSGDWSEVGSEHPLFGKSGALPDEQLPITELTDDLYASIVAKTTEKGTASAGALSVTFDISFEIAEQAFDRMELEGVIDAEGNLAESETFPVMV